MPDTDEPLRGDELPDEPGFACPQCNIFEWRWTEYGQWGFYICDSCREVHYGGWRV